MNYIRISRDLEQQGYLVQLVHVDNDTQEETVIASDQGPLNIIEYTIKGMLPSLDIDF